MLIEKTVGRKIAALDEENTGDAKFALFKNSSQTKTCATCYFE